MKFVLVEEKRQSHNTKEKRKIVKKGERKVAVSLAVSLGLTIIISGTDSRIREGLLKALVVVVYVFFFSIFSRPVIFFFVLAAAVSCFTVAAAAEGKLVPAEGFLFVEQGKLHYRLIRPEGGDGMNKPLVLLHMSPRSMDEFKELIESMRVNGNANRCETLSPASF